MSNRARVWVVCQIGWEYDDNYYSNQGIESLSNCFTVKELAEEQADIKNAAYLRSKYAPRIGYHYDEDWELASCDPQVLMKLGWSEEKAYRVADQVNDRGEDLSKFSDEDIIAILKACRISFFTVQEVEIYA